MHPFDEMKEYVGFSADDAARLRALHTLLGSEEEEIIDAFYQKILDSGARSVLESEEQVERLRLTFRVWLAELLEGPHDYDYFERRERIGRRHVEVGLHSRYMLMAMAILREKLCDAAHRLLDEHESVTTCHAVQRITSIDLAIMTGTYVVGREQKQLRSLQDLLVDHLPAAVMLIDADDTVVAATPPAARLAGGTALGRNYRDAVPAVLLDACSLPERLQHALARDQPVFLQRVDYEVGRRTRSMRVTLVPLNHDLARALILLEDLTDTVAAEARLHRTEALAQLGSLSAAVAHELRNPLAGISGAVQVISGSFPEGDTRRVILGKVQEQITRLNDLVSDLLAFARPGSARLQDVDLNTVVEGVLELVRPQHPEVSFDIVGKGRASADLNLLHQVVLNLVQNAVQAQDEVPRPQVALHLSQGQVDIADGGPGVPDDLHDEIFQPFFTTRTRGTGLGLAISHRAVRAMNGELSLVEGPLAGACFRLALRPPDGALS